MNRATATAIDAYRDLLKAEERVRLLGEELTNSLRDPELDPTEYAYTTMAIDQRLDETLQLADAAGWAPSTRKQRIAAAINTAAINTAGAFA